MQKRRETATFGLVAWLESTRISLPLKGVEARFVVCGDLLNVEIDQIFHQNSPRPLDCLYSFPLPAAAAVYRCEMHVNDRVIRAKVEEVGRAREIVREQKAAGHRTALVEMERDNLFTLALGNLQPEDVVVIRFAYFQTLTRLADWRSFTIPFCPGVRYIPGKPLLRGPRGRGTAQDTDQVPDASRISPPRIDRLHKDAAYLSLQGTVEARGGEVREVTSPTHPLLVHDGAEQFEIGLGDTAFPDSDFVLRWTEVPGRDLHPVGWVTREAGESFALVCLQAPVQAEVDPEYGQDVYFLLDHSGSMQGLKWEKTVQAFRAFVSLLGPKDRVWATLFATGFQDLAEQPLSPAVVLADEGARRLETLAASGGTELSPALEHVLGKIKSHSSGRPVALVIITDGQIGNERQILEQTRPHSNVRVHTFGIDLAVNDGFLKKLAAQHRGSSCLLSPNDDIVGAVSRLGDRLRRPVLTGIHADATWELPNGEVPDLHSAEALSIALKGPADARAVALSGQLAGKGPESYRFELSEKQLAALPLLWAKERIDQLLVKGQRQAALDLAKKYNLVCDGAAFVAWDEAEKVPISAVDDEVYQPSMLVGAQIAATSYVGSAPKTRASASLRCLLSAAPPREADTPPSVSAGGSFWSKWLGANTPEQSRGLAWAQLETDLRRFFPFQEAQELMEMICDWAQDDDALQERRFSEVSALKRLLESASTASKARLEVLRRWIEDTWRLEPALLSRARAILAQVQALSAETHGGESMKS